MWESHSRNVSSWDSWMAEMSRVKIEKAEVDV
jgi:hypothetical protein